jgi:hypothetical protein
MPELKSIMFNFKPLQAAAWAVVLSACCTAALSQEAEVAIGKPPHYIDEPLLVRVVVRGFDEQPQPTVQIETASPELTAQLVSAKASVSSSVRIVQDPISGRRRVSESKTVVWPFDYQVVARTPGTYTMGPFLVEQGDKKARTKSLTVTFQDVELDPNMRVRLQLPGRPVYPDERVPVTIEWSFAGDLGSIDRLRIRSPLFDRFSFAPDAQPGRGSSVLPIETREGQIPLEAEVRRETEDGKQVAIVTAKRTLVPNRPGEYELEPISATLRKVTRWSRARSPLDDFGFGGSMFEGFFGDSRRPAETQLSRAVGRAQTLVVAPFPEEGRPESFVGAVGPGFSVDVTADRTMVRVGDPITLNVALTGQGNLENASLPALSADGGLDPQRFRLPSGDVRGLLQDGVKRFPVTVRVEDAAVTEIPSIAYSWFDPRDQAYHTSRSQPIALRVLPAKIITADSVVSSRSDTTQSMAAAAGNNMPGDTPGTSAQRQGLVSSTGADLAIEQDPVTLLRDGRRTWGGPALWAVLYLIGLLCVALAVVDRRLKEIPPEVIHRRKLLHELQRRVEQASKMPPRQASQQVAVALRTVLAEVPNAPRDEIDSVVGQCESLAFAPVDGPDGSLDPALISRARAILDRISKDVV